MTKENVVYLRRKEPLIHPKDWKLKNSHNLRSNDWHFVSRRKSKKKCSILIQGSSKEILKIISELISNGEFKIVKEK